MIAAVEDLQKTTKAHANRLDGAEGRLDECESILDRLKLDMNESRATLRRIEDKLDGRLRDALNAIPAWMGVILALLTVLIGAVALGHDLWPFH